MWRVYYFVDIDDYWKEWNQENIIKSHQGSGTVALYTWDVEL